MIRLQTLLTIAFLTLALAGCGDDPPSGDACDFDEECVGALVCLDGLCVLEGCTAGNVGCACSAGDRCARGSDGTQLMCVDGVCSSPSCPSGEDGCACIDGETCNGDGSACLDGYCFPAECEDGTVSCPCVAGSCDAGLHCLDGAICVDDDGYEGGPCLESGRCNPGNRCDATLEICVYCDAGTEGCQCNGGSCNGGLSCVADLCVDGATLPPADPLCYTPCRDALETDGVTRACDSDDQLLDGCVGDKSCSEGSCLGEGETKTACTDDLDCPFFQTCLSGGCYSNCESNADCSLGMGCYHRVCRVPCEADAGSAACGDGYRCDTDDGTNGYCIPTTNSVGGGGESGDTVAFALSEEHLDFSNVRTEKALTIVPEDGDDRRLTFTLRRLWHEVTDEMGDVTRVEAERDSVTGALEPCDAAAGECPMAWLDIRVPGEAASREPEVSLDLFGDCAGDDSCPTIEFANAAGIDAVRWTGAIEISSGASRTNVRLSYVERPDGQWVGTMYYFGNFDDTGIADWELRTDKSNVTGVSNGLIRRWAAFRAGSLQGGWDEMVAVLTSTRTESWTFGEVRDRCTAADGACYPYTNASGVRRYVTDLENTPIPSGVTGLPFAMNLRASPGDPLNLNGRIETSLSLHYPGYPAVSLAMGSDPSSEAACDSSIQSVSGDCVVWLDSFQASAIVGGRTVLDGASCPSGFVEVEEPWLVEGFTGDTSADATGSRSRTVCLDGELPYDSASDSTLVDLNQSLAGGNPVPDGVARTRTVRLLDGALVNQSQIIVLFQETFDTFVDVPGSSGVSAYGYLMLSRQAANLADDDEDGDGIADVYQGNEPPTVSQTTPTMPGASCDPDLVADLVTGSSVTTGNVDALTRILIGGTQLAGTPSVATNVHYYCEETGLFDGGPDDDGTSGAVKIRCPAGSRVVFFTTPTLTQADIAGQACQQTVVCEPGFDLDDVGGTDADDTDVDIPVVCREGTCQTRLTELRANGQVGIYEPNYECNDPNTAYCDEDREDLRAGKTFYAPVVSVGRSLDPLQASIDQAFRYRTRFRSSNGSRPGFAPRICIPNSDQIPYCYDPGVIEEIADRIDCLVSIYSDDTLIGALTATTRSELQRFLKGSFSQFEDPNGDRDGFERLYSELLVMQGDEALTKAFASRFDLAGVGGASFQGSLLEPGGIDLSGVAGFEMVSLYRAVQLYQLALDRMYELGPDFSEALTRNPSVDSSLVFLSDESVTLYLERLIRASTQKSRAYSEIAKRYQNLNRPDLARRVVVRAYTAANMEGVIIQELMSAIADRADNADKPQIELAITQAQRRYRMALLDMRNIYSSITDSVNFFGFAPDYIPFPALDASARGRNAFEVLINTARTKASFARVREQEALASNRSFQTDEAQFQSELVRIRNTYDNQLAEICGTMESPYDGRIYPAIRAYAEQNPWAANLGDPCGRMGNGAIHRALVGYQTALIAQQQVGARLNALLDQVDIERERVSDQCDRIVELADFQFEQAGETKNLQLEIMDIRANVEAQNSAITAAADLAANLLCVPPVYVLVPPAPPIPDPSACVNQALDAKIRGVAAGITTAATFATEQVIIGKQRDILNIQRDTAQWQTLQECDFATIESNARTTTMLLQLEELELEQLRANYDSQLAASEIDRLFNQAVRIEDERDETQSLNVDIQAARNDPNVRVYRNDAIINADVAFEDAMRAAYRATKVFEYYTSQSYAEIEKLFLIRMVGAGEYNLENYLLDLENAFFDFEELYGAPDTRVLQLSLMDDILQIPTLDNDGNPIADGERYRMLRERMQDVDYLDRNGYVTVGFGTDLERLSPLTRNHKVLRIEAEMAVTSGDHVGRLYLRQAGTGVVRGLDDETSFYVFPERTAVLNPFFNGNRPFDPEVYRSTRFRDRPLVHTQWELVFNQRDELENKDIQLDTLTDIRLYIYYQDFTAL